MTEEAKQESVKLGRVIPLSIGLVALFYVLSMGPAYRLLRKGVVQQKTFSSLYAPMQYLSDRCRPFDRAVDWYLTFWYSDEREIIRQMKQWKSQSE